MEVFLKSFALFFILQTYGTVLTVVLWFMVERKIPKLYRPSALTISLILPVFSSAIITLLSSLSSASGYFPMLYPSFSFLMRGSLETIIIIIGVIAFLVSLLASLILLGEPKAPIREVIERYFVAGAEIIVSPNIATAAAFGIRRPLIAISPSLWKDSEKLSIALIHELFHIHLRHNLLKFLARIVLRMNFFNPLIHRAIDRLEVLCELDVDTRICALIGRGRYANFLKELPQVALAEASGVSTALSERLHELSKEDRGLPFLGLAPAILSTLSIISPLLFSTTRCLTVCFLGY